MPNENPINPSYLYPHYSTKICRSYYNYLSVHYNKSFFYETCEALGMPPEYLLQDNNWISHDFRMRFTSEIKRKTGDNDIARKVGQSVLSSENVNPLEIALIKLLGPFVFFFSFAAHGAKANRFSSYTRLRAWPGNFVIKLSSKGNKPHDPDTCKSAIGTFEAAKTFYGLDYLEVNHDRCIHRGENECLFKIRYSRTRHYLKLIFALMVAILTLKFCGRLAQEYSGSEFLMKSLFISLFVVISAGAFVFNRIKAILKFQSVFYEQNKSKEQTLYESKVMLDRRYREANMQRELSLSLVTKSSTKDVVVSCLNDLEKQFGYERLLVMLMDSEKSKLQTVDVRGFESHREMLFNLSLPYPATKEGPQLFANILASGIPTLITDVEDYKKDLQPINQMLITALNVKNLIVAPIQDYEKKYGILVVGAIDHDKQLSNDDKYLIENVSRMLALFFKQVSSFERERTLRNVFQKYVPSVVMESLQMLEAGRSSLVVPQNNVITSMFIDLRDFTKTSESLPPERVMEMLSIYIDHTTDIIACYGGIIDNLVGDGIVSFFPAGPEARSLHAKMAVICAIEILAKIPELNKKLQAKGFPNVRIGIGLHSGNATVGNVGGRVRVNYTAIGDTVNVAARLEGACKEFTNVSPSAESGLIVLSDAVLKLAPLNEPPIAGNEINVRGRMYGLRVHLIDFSMASELAKTDSNLLFKELDTDSDEFVGDNQRIHANKKPAA